MEGTVPVKVLLERSRISKEDINPISVGMAPVSRLFPNQRDSSFVRKPMAVGMGPVNRFESNIICLAAVNAPI